MSKVSQTMKACFAAKSLELFAALFVLSGDAHAFMTVLVSNYSDKTITQYDLSTGNYLGVFASTAASPYSMTADGNGYIYVAFNDKSIHKYNIGGTDFGSIATMSSTDDMIFYRAGFLYESGYNNGLVRKLGLDGTDFGTFATLDTSGLQGMATVGGMLLVNDYNGASHGGTIRKVAADGTDLGQFATLGGSGYSPLGLTVDGSGNVYASDWAKQNVRKFDSAGADLLTFATGKQVYALAAGTNNSIYITSSSDNAILEYKTDGSYMGVFTSTGIGGPTAIIIIPEPSTGFLLAFGIATLAGFRRRKH